MRMELTFEVKFFEKDNDTSFKYISDVRKFLKFHFDDYNRGSRNGYEPSMTIEVDDNVENETFHEICSKISRFHGKVVQVRQMTKRTLLDIVSDYCFKASLNGSFIRFHDSNYEKFNVFETPLSSRRVRQLYSISMGTILKLDQFVPHVVLRDERCKHCINQSDIRFASMKAVFENDKKRLLLRLRDSECDDYFEFLLKYTSIKQIIMSLTNEIWSLFLILAFPPLLYKNEDVDDDDHDETADLDDDYDMDGIKATSDVIYSKTPIRLRETIMSSVESSSVISRCNVVQLEMFPPIHRFIHFEDRKKNYYNRVWSVVRNINRQTKAPIHVGRVNVVSGGLRNDFVPIPRDIPFNVWYAFRCLDHLSFQLHDELVFEHNTDMFVETIENMSAVNPKATELALFDLFWLFDNSVSINYTSLFIKKFEMHSNKQTEKREDIVELRRCIFTPSRIIFLPPLPYLKSRFFRDADPEFAMRLCLRDDDMDSLAFTVCTPGTYKYQRMFLKKVIVEPLSEGIKFRQRKYEFLGGSTSQLRQLGMFLYAMDESGMDADCWRKRIGDLKHIKNPSKYISRIGQAFSQAIAHLKFNSRVVVEKDIVGGEHPETGKPYIFSDGIGKISELLAMEMTVLLSEERSVPFSAFQIRYGGAKGMVAIDPSLEGHRMILRESMVKYPSHSTYLEILKESKPRSLSLNKQFINILDQLGVESYTFVSLQRQCLESIVDSYHCSCKALEVINKYSFSKTILNYELLRNSEINIFREPFIRGVLDVVVSYAVKSMKERARLLVPENWGRTLFGVLDETGTLNYGEVFVQFSEKYACMQRTILNGEVMVTKFPCMSAGDVRKFTAVDKPSLHHICDCIVFPRRGHRPHPDEMAGSDLDGDEYAVIWNESLFFPGDNEKAMDYPSSSAEKTVEKEVTVEDMLSFYASFIQNNQVGTIANAHLALSDHEGIFAEDCMTLCEQYAMFLDYAKSGVLDDHELISAKQYPDFMEKWETKPTYKSHRVLGKLYRLCCLFEEMIESNSKNDVHCGGNELLLTFPNWKNYEKTAEEAYYQYCNKIAIIQQRFGIDNEMTLLSGIRCKVDKYFGGKDEKHDGQRMIASNVEDVIRELRSFFHEKVAQRSNEMKAKASAWYLVTNRLNKNNKNPFFGLPWIVSDILCEVAQHNSGTRRPHHLCLLQKELTIEDFSYDEIHENRSYRYSLVKHALTTWFKSVVNRYHTACDTNLNDIGFFRSNLKPIMNSFLKKYNHTSVHYAVVKILLNFSDLWRKSDEVLCNFLSLSALISLRRLVNTKHFFVPLQNSSGRKEVVTICLSLRNKEFRKYFMRHNKEMNKKLRETGVDEICFHVQQRPKTSKIVFDDLYVTAVGYPNCTKMLRNVLTRETFYSDIVSPSFYI